MCTVTVIPLPGGGLRLVSSRDELRTRVPAERPIWRELDGGIRAVWPTDPRGGGTWIAAGEHGLALTVLNVNLEPAPELDHRMLTSRGMLIPALIESRDAEQAMERLSGLDLDRYAPFRLVAADLGGATRRGVRTIAARWDRERLERREVLDGPACFVSSGLGDSRVRDRIGLFEQMLAQEPTTAAQDGYHAHFWPDRLPVSVWMSRREARTVSVTSVRLEPSPGKAGARARLVYRPVGEPEPASVAR